MIGSVETRIARAIAIESLDRHEHPVFTAYRWGYKHHQVEMIELVGKLRKEILSPPPSAARARAMKAQTDRFGSEN